MEEEIKQEKTVEHLTEEIKVLLNDISVPNANTQRNDDQCVDARTIKNKIQFAIEELMFQYSGCNT